MPKVTIHFDLPEEQHEYDQCNEAGNLASIIYEFTLFVRDRTKYGDGKPASWEEVKTYWWNLLQEAKYDPYGN
jgi:hypothetical protein